MDERSLSWPPTGDTRSLRVFHYRYPAVEGYGVVGGPEPFSMHSDDGPLLAKLTDIYAMACCHQLKQADDPRGQDCDLARGRPRRALLVPVDLNEVVADDGYTGIEYAFFGSSRRRKAEADPPRPTGRIHCEA